MLDETSPRAKIIAAALKLAAEKRWRDVSLIDIAEAAGVTLAELRGQFAGKGAIVRGLVRATDDKLLADVRRPVEGDHVRDTLFEVIMARFDLMAPHKAAIRSITAEMDADPSMLRAFLDSQRWMLQAAGVDADGPRGAVRTFGLATVYGSVFRTWLDDDDPGMARTMAALDRRLRRGERNLETLEGACETVGGFARRIGDILGGIGRARAAAGPAGATTSAPKASAPSADASG